MLDKETKKALFRMLHRIPLHWAEFEKAVKAKTKKLGLQYERSTIHCTADRQSFGIRLEDAEGALADFYYRHTKVAWREGKLITIQIDKFSPKDGIPFWVIFHREQ